MRTQIRPLHVQQAVLAGDTKRLREDALKGAAARKKINAWKIQKALHEMREIARQANEHICPVD